jgi:hypothetical protein
MSTYNKFYYKTDFVQIVSVADNAVLPFTLTYFTVEGGNTFVASFDGTKYTNCQRQSDGSILVIFDSHNLECGRLKCECNVKIANTDYVTDSTDNEINLYTTSVALYDGPTVISTEAKESFGAIYRGYSAYDLAVQNGYTGTVAEWLTSLKQPALDAATTANEAATKANTATANADAATTNANNAATSANAAATAANKAKTDADTATASANSAASSASTAATNADNTNATVTADEEKRKSAETNRVNAETLREQNENARKDNETARQSSETERTSNETARKDAESKRATSEADRASAESSRVTEESERVAAESARVTEFSTLKTDSETAANNANTSASNANTAADNANAAAASAMEVLKNVASLGTWVFMVRKHENADPSAYKFIGTQANIKLLGEHCRMGWFKNRTAYTICAKGRITKDTHGNDIAMDGTAGDLLTFFDCDVHHYENTVTDATDGVIDIIGLGLNPTILYGKGSSVMPAFGITTDHTVIAKLSSDTASCSHCIYSKSVNGTYSAPTTILFNEVYQSSGAGKPTVGYTSMSSIASSQNKNADGIHGDGWYGMYYICYQIWLEMMIMEGGTVCSTVTDTGFGVGNTYGDTPTSSTFSGSKIIGNSGVKFILSDGTVKGYGNLMSQNIKLSSTGSVVCNMLPLTGNSYYAWQDMLEAQRMADAIVKNGFESYVGTATNVFYYDDDGQLQVDTAGNIDLSTGTGMTANKRYYVVRGVNGYDGLSDGVMTCLVNYYIKMTFVDDAYYSDGTSLKGGFAIYKFSTPMYRGVSWFDGTFNHLQGFHYVIHADANGNYSSSAIYQPDYKALPSITSNDSANDYGLETDTLLMEKGFIHTESIPMTEGWAKNCYPSISLFYCPNIGGAGMRTYESNYIWRNACWGEGVNGKPANGYKCIQASAVGCAANNSNASVRSMYANSSASNNNSSFGCGSALIDIDMG